MKKLVKIGASWCGPCKVLDIKLKQLYLPDDRLIKLDVEEESFKSSGFPLPRNIPTVHIVDAENNIIETFVGTHDVSTYREALK